MHYLEDYLELLEPLREMIHEKLTLMCENDLKLQIEFAQLEEDSSKFLNDYYLYQKQSLLSPTKTKINVSHLTSSMNDQKILQLTSEQFIAQQEKQSEYDKLVQRHEQLHQLTATKMILANESHEFIERYYKKLENDLNNFKMELEADYSGLTEILEKRFAREDRIKTGNRTDENNTFDSSLLDIEPLFNPFDELAMSNSFSNDYTNQSIFSKSRRSSTGLTPCKSLSILNRKRHQCLHSNPSISSRSRKRLQSTSSIKRKANVNHNSHSDSDEFSSNNILTNDYYNLNLFPDETNEGLNSSNLNEQITETIDERCYCFCNEISYGDMIACDNSTCRREWFHYSCVGIITPPKGKWFCAECVQILR